MACEKVPPPMGSAIRKGLGYPMATDKKMAVDVTHAAVGLADVIPYV